MIKKTYIILLIFAFVLSGCSSNKILGVRDSVDAFYQAYYDADINEMYKYISDTMESPILDFCKEDFEDASIPLDTTNDFSYKIESVVESENAAYVNIKFICYDLSKIMMDDFNSGYDYNKFDLDSKEGLKELYDHYKILIENTSDEKIETTRQVKMIKKNNKWYFEAKEYDVMVPLYELSE